MSSSTRNILPPLADILPPQRSRAPTANMGQGKSSKSPSKAKTQSRSKSQPNSQSKSQELGSILPIPCFHQPGKSDANVNLLLKKGVWIGKLSLLASGEVESLPKFVPSSCQFSNFYCNSCVYGRNLRPVLCSFTIRGLQKDNAEVK